MTKKALIVGCSLTAGFEMYEEKDTGLSSRYNPRHPRIWATQLMSQLGNFEIHNLSEPGVNNNWIFMKAMTELAQTHYDLVLIQWTFLDRIYLPVGLELYHTHTMLAGEKDVNLVSKVKLSAPWLRDVGRRLQLLNNHHWDILNLVKYVNILKSFQDLRHGKVCFVNGAVNWSRDYFTKKQISFPSELSQFEREMIDSDNRDDEETKAIYDMIHNQYSNSGSCQFENWLNIYDPLLTQKIDSIAPNDIHPGYISQDFFAEMLFPTLKEYYYKDQNVSTY